MPKTNDKNKTERIYTRIEKSLKSDLQDFTSAREETISDFLRSLIIQTIYPLSHEEQIEKALAENKIYNNLMTGSKLPNKSKQIISEELKKYV